MGKVITNTKETSAEKIERTGDTSFNVIHDSGDIFEMTGPKQVVDKLSRYRGAPASKKMFNGVNFDKDGNIIR